MNIPPELQAEYDQIGRQLRGCLAKKAEVEKRMNDFLCKCPCEICGEMPLDGKPIQSCTVMGKDPPAICVLCFEAWYEDGITNRDEIKTSSLSQRAKRIAREEGSEE